MHADLLPFLGPLVTGVLTASAAVVAVMLTQRSERKREAERFERERSAQVEQFERDQKDRNDGLRRDRLEKLSEAIFAFRDEVEAARESALVAQSKVDTSKIYLSRIQMYVDLYLPSADTPLKTLIERTYALLGRLREIDPANGRALDRDEINRLVRGVREAATALQSAIAGETRKILTL